MAIIYQKKAFWVLFLFLFTVSLTNCNNSNGKKIVLEKSYDAEKLLWSDIRKDSSLVLKGCKKLLQEFPESAQAQVTAYLGYANYYEKKKDNANATAYSQKALTIAQKNGLNREIAYCHAQLSEISNNLNNLNEMALHLQKINEILENNAILDELLRCKYHEEKALYLRKTQKYEEAIAEFRKMLNLSQKNNYIFWKLKQISTFHGCLVRFLNLKNVPHT